MKEAWNILGGEDRFEFTWEANVARFERRKSQKAYVRCAWTLSILDNRKQFVILGSRGWFEAR